MVQLGKIRIGYNQSLNETRNKILSVASNITRNKILAIRLSFAISEISRILISNNVSDIVKVSIGQQENKLSFNLQLINSIDFFEHFLRLKPFFDCMEIVFNKRNKKEIFLSKTLPYDAQALMTQDNIKYLKDIIAEKSRVQLMLDLKDKNKELKKSLHDLRTAKSEREKFYSELNIGRNIQMNMLPLEFPLFPERKEFNVFAKIKPAKEVGGDLYDLFFLDNGNLCFYVGDVSGKGIPAALFMAVTKTLIKSIGINDLSAASILTEANEELAQNNDSCMFVTIFIAILDLNTGEMQYSNAGHNPPFVKRKKGDLIRLDQLGGAIVGAIDGSVYSEQSFQVMKGDLIFLYTDGVTEAMNSNNELYSEERLINYLTNVKAKKVNEVINSLIDDVLSFQGKAAQADDIALLALEYIGGKVLRDDQKFKIKLKNEVSELVRFSQEFNKFIKKNKLPKTLSGKLNIIFDELLNNIISYAYPEQDENFIEVYLELRKEYIKIYIVDHGVPFNPFCRPKPDTGKQLDERSIGGLGIHIVKSLMDKVEYHRRSNKNLVILEKYMENTS